MKVIDRVWNFDFYGVSLHEIHAVLMERSEILIASIFPALNSSLIYSWKQYLFLCYHLWKKQWNLNMKESTSSENVILTGEVKEQKLDVYV